MLRLHKKTLYAIEAVLDIAYHAGEEPVQSGDITRRQNIPRRYLEQTLQRLVRAAILVGVRGPRGGYRLARERRRITVADIVRVVDDLTEANGGGVEEGSELGQKVVHPIWSELRVTAMNRLAGMTIEDLCSQADGQGIESEGRANLDFAI